MFDLTQYLVGTGGWSYFDVGEKSPLKTYSKVFNFVEVNSTFYEYPRDKNVERWRMTVPASFVFAVRCHQDLTHRLRLRPGNEAYSVLGKMLSYCRRLDAPFLVLETPSSYALTAENVESARKLLTSFSLKDVRLAWEIRSPMTPHANAMMQDLGIIHAVDLSREEPAFSSDVMYSRLFGKGVNNAYQFTDEELLEIDEKVSERQPKIAALSYHGIRMNTDAARFALYKKTGKFMQATPFTGIKSVETVLSEDAHFPTSKEKVIDQQGWKVIDWTEEKRVHLSRLLINIPERTYFGLKDLVRAVEENN